MYKFRLIDLTLSDDEEARVQKTIKDALVFMENHVKVYLPPMANKSHYLNSQHPYGDGCS